MRFARLLDVQTHFVAFFAIALLLTGGAVNANSTDRAVPSSPVSSSPAPASPLPASPASAGTVATGAAVSGEAPAAAVQPSNPFETQGIYLQQYTAQSPKRLDHLINNSLEVGINTLVVDVAWRSPIYAKAVERIQHHGLRYVPRITMFPDGGTHEQVSSQKFWEERWKLVSYAIELGAKDIQLDYIRYKSRTEASPHNAINIREVLRFFKKRINERGAQLQIDVFGEVSHGPSLHIGQDMGLFAPEIDAVCPMVYPSHYEPYEERRHQPFETVFDSLTALKRQMGAQQVPVLAYIELFNHRFPMDAAERVKYIRAQLRAVREAHAEGWLAWSAGNRYDILFEILRRFRQDAAG